LTPEQRDSIYGRLCGGESITALAKEYGITPQAVSQQAQKRGLSLSARIGKWGKWKRMNFEGGDNVII
jgi:transposase-like protein